MSGESSSEQEEQETAASPKTYAFTQGTHLGNSFGKRVQRGSVFAAYRRLSVQAGGSVTDSAEGAEGEGGGGGNEDDEEELVAAVINNAIRALEHIEALGDASDQLFDRMGAYTLCAQGEGALSQQLHEALDARERARKGGLYTDPSFNALSEARRQQVMTFMRLVRGGMCAEAEVMLRADSSLAEARDFGGTSPLHVSVMLKDFRLSRLLLHHGASLSVTDATGLAVSAYAVKKDPLAGEQLRLLESSLRAPRALTVEEERFAAFRRAASKGDLQTLAELHSLDNGLVLMQDERCQTALIVACASCQYDAAKVLLLYGSDWKHRSRLGGLEAFPSQFVPDKAKRRELKEYAWWQTLRGRREAERLRVLQELNDERARETGDNLLMTLEESRRRRFLANEATTSELCLSTAAAVVERVFCVSERTAIRRRCKEIEEELERQRKAAVLARRLAREEALRLKREERRRKFMQFGVALCDSARAERRGRVRAEIQRRRERAEWEAAEAARLALLEEQRLRREKELRAMQDRAIEEWEQLQAEIERQKWEAFMAKRPQRLLTYNRLRNASALVSSSNAFLLEKRVLPQSRGAATLSPQSSRRRASPGTL